MMAVLSGIRSFLLRLVRGVMLLVGIAVFAFGALAVFVPGVAELLPVGRMIDALGSDYVVVAAVGLVAVAFAVLVLLVVAISGVDEADLPIVESVESAPHPGQAVDRSVEGGSGFGVSDARMKRLTEAAVRTLMRAEHCSRSTAERRIAEGTWTDDDIAADFLATGDDGLLRTAVSDEERVRRTAVEIERLNADDTGDDGGGNRGDGTAEGTASTDQADDEGQTAATETTVKSRRRDATLTREGNPRRGGAGTGGK